MTTFHLTRESSRATVKIDIHDRRKRFHIYIDTAGSELGREGTLLGAKGLAMTALDLLYHPTLLNDIKAAFQQS